jgi:hypothetical protein
VPYLVTNVSALSRAPRAYRTPRRPLKAVSRSLGTIRPCTAPAFKRIESHLPSRRRSALLTSSR